jgi:hypothetical protein
MPKRRARNAPVHVPLSTRSDMTGDVPVLVEQDRVRHAAHYMYEHPARGHDLDRWIVRAAVRPTREQLSTLGLLGDAECHTGHIDPDTGRQYWIYLAKRPLSEGTCDRCRHRDLNGSCQS